MNHTSPYWKYSYFLQYFEMSESEFQELHEKGRVNLCMRNGRRYVDIEVIYLPSKYKEKVESLG